MLYSYDIFDTLLTRKTATPKGIFSVIQSIILLIINDEYLFGCRKILILKFVHIALEV